MRKKRVIWSLIGLLIASYLGTGTYFWATQDDAIFKPRKQIKATPAELDPPLEYEYVKIPTEQSAIHGYWLPGASNAPTVLYLHGQDVTIGNNLHHAQCLNQLGCNVLVIDYRGYGATFGSMTPSESSVHQDAEVAWSYLTSDRSIAPEQILIYGHSLGGAIAIELATHHPEAGGLIAESSFTSVKQIARWKYAVTYLLPLNILLRHRFDSIGTVRENSLPPVLFVHGTADSKVPYFMSQQLYEATAGSNKEIVLIKGGEHANHGDGETDYWEKLLAFMHRCFGPTSLEVLTK